MREAVLFGPSIQSIEKGLVRINGVNVRLELRGQNERLASDTAPSIDDQIESMSGDGAKHIQSLLVVAGTEFVHVREEQVDRTPRFHGCVAGCHFVFAFAARIWGKRMSRV